jgi:diguanylate cyclase (GGDEF)-like protein
VKSIRYALLAVAACGFLLIVAGGGVILGVRHTDDLGERQEEVGNRIFAARQVYESLLGMESSQRGFLLTGDPLYLEPYQRHDAESAATIGNLEHLYEGAPSAQSILGDIHRLANAKHAELRATIALVRSGEHDAALSIVRNNSGKQAMDELRKRLLALVAQQRAVRTGYLDEARATLRRLYLGGAGIAVLVMALVGIAMRSLSHSIARLDDAQKREEHNAMHDALTGLPNRRYLDEWLATALAGARRGGRPLHVLYFDLDGFKAVNDRFGHEAGDKVLQVTADRLRETLRASDFVARLGGDEFIAALPETGESPALDALLRRLEQRLAAAQLDELEDGAVTASIGQACFPRDGEDAAALLAAADRAMYRIKEQRHTGRERAERARHLAPAPREHQTA